MIEALTHSPNTEKTILGWQDFVVYPDKTRHISREDVDGIFEEFRKKEPAFLLLGTGFNIKTQVQRWQELANKGPETATQEIIDQTILDIQGFFNEYLSGNDIFPIDAELKKENGENKIVSPKYGVLFIDIVDQKEREGALHQGLKTVTQILEQGLQPESCILLVSPPGWSGYEVNGKKIIYPDNQIYIYFVDKNGDLEALTLRTDISVEESLFLTKIKQSNDERLNIKKVVSSPIVLSAENIPQVLTEIETRLNRKFPDLKQQLFDRQTIFKIKGAAAEIIANLKTDLQERLQRFDSENISTFIRLVGKCILDLETITHIKEPKNQYDYLYLTRQNEPEYAHYENMLQSLQTKAGCNGGGMDGTGRLNGAEIQGGDEYGDLNFKCPSCGKNNTRPHGKLIPNCQHCGADVRC